MPESKLSFSHLALLVLVLALSLALRLVALDGFETADESLWHYRGLEFDKALQTRQWQYTYQTGHPGVVTMWLGAIANRLEWLQRPLVSDHDAIRALMQSPAPAPGTGLPPVTLGARRLVALTTWLGIVALYPLLRKLFDARVALCATVLVGLDPFFLAHSRLHHLDGLLTTFAVLSAVSLLVYQFRGRRPGYLLASAATGALAIANKSPGVLLLPWAGLVLVLPALWKARSLRHREVWRSVGALAIWVLGAALVIVAIWPVMWVRPLTILENVFGVARQYVGNPHENSNYFWFAIHPDPGPAFYPVAWAFRTTPWVLLGLAGLVAARRQRQWRLAGAWMLLWVLLFTAGMTIGEKKFDRYLLPVFPFLDILAAAGWVAAVRRWLRPRLPAWSKWCAVGLVALLVVGQLALLWPGRPYYLACYNPLLGGSKTAPRVMLIGWGEGLDRAAAYLNAKPDARKLVVASWRRPEFGGFFMGETVDRWKPQCLANSDYFVLYRNVAQRNLVPEAARRFVAEEEPEHVVWFNGIEYAAIYENMLYRQAEEEIIRRVASRADAQAHVILVEGSAPLARGYRGPVPLVEFTAPTRDDAMRTALQEASAGRRHIWLLVYPDSADCGCGAVAEQLGRCASVGEELEVHGVRAIRYDLPEDSGFVPRPSVATDVRLGERIRLLGYDVAQPELVPGQPLHVRLHWQAGDSPGVSYTVFVHLLGPDGNAVSQADGLPQGAARPTTTWRAGATVLDDHELAVPPDAPPGDYSLAVGLYQLETMQRLEALDETGQRLPNDALIIAGLQVRER